MGVAILDHLIDSRRGRGERRHLESGGILKTERAYDINAIELNRPILRWS